MESSHPLLPKDPSPTLSAVSKDEPNQFTAKQFSCVKEGEGASETKAGNSEMNSSDKKVVINTDVCVATAESLSKGPKSHQSPPMPGDIREKKLAGEQGNKYMLVMSHLFHLLLVQMSVEVVLLFEISDFWIFFQGVQG